jgi:ABC-type transport system involved in cytochrome bd biosynthesis fused ATPase/permease subunit
MDHGRIVESGRHAQLLARAGLYARLYETEFAPGEAPALAVAEAPPA